MENTKKCSKCGIEKNLTEFGVRRAKKDGRLAKCRACRKTYDPAKTLVCTKCGIRKPREGFWKRKDGRDGLRPECIYCSNMYTWALLKKKRLNS